MLVEDGDHRLAQTLDEPRKHCLLGHRLAQPAETGNGEMHPIGGHPLGRGMRRLPGEQRPRHHLRLVEHQDARGPGLDRRDAIGDQPVAGAAPDGRLRRAFPAAGDRGGDRRIDLLVGQHDDHRFRLVQIGRGDQIGGRGRPFEPDQPAVFDRLLRQQHHLAAGTERQRQLFGVGIVADDHDMTLEPRRPPGDEPLAEHHPEAAQQRQVEHQRRREGAEQRQHMLRAEKGAVEGEGQQHRIERILPARMALRIEQPPADHEDDGKDRQRRDDGRQNAAARSRSAIVHQAPMPLL